MYVLIAHNERAMIEAIAFNCLKHGHMVLTASDGCQCLDIAQSLRADLLILDAHLTKIDGFEVCRTVRACSSIPIITLSSSPDRDAMSKSETCGANGHMGTPFSMIVLMEKTNRLLEAQTGLLPNRVNAGNVELSVAQRSVHVGDTKLEALDDTQFRLLHLLMSRPGRVFSRVDLYRHIFQEDTLVAPAKNRSIDACMANLMAAISTDPSNPSQIAIVRSIGWMFDADSYNL